jgi:hypothetical protein
MDSKVKNAFDSKEKWIWDVVDNDSTVLAPMLDKFKNSPSYIAYKLSVDDAGFKGKGRILSQQ